MGWLGWLDVCLVVFLWGFDWVGGVRDLMFVICDLMCDLLCGCCVVVVVFVFVEKMT